MNKMTLHQLGEADEFRTGGWDVCPLASSRASSPACYGAMIPAVFENMCLNHNSCPHYQQRKPIPEGVNPLTSIIYTKGTVEAVQAGGRA